MLPCEADELVHIGSDGLHAALHGRYAVAPSLKAGALTPDGPELLVCDAGRPASVHSAQIAANTNTSPGPSSRISSGVYLLSAIVMYFIPCKDTKHFVKVTTRFKKGH